MRGFLRNQLPVPGLENGYRKMFFMVSGFGLGLSTLTAFTAFAAPRLEDAPEKKPEEVWLSENNGGRFVSYVDMAGATVDQLYYRHNQSGTFDPDPEFKKNFNAFLLCLIALELKNFSEFQYRLLQLQSMADKAFLKDANAFLAAAAYDIAIQRPLHMVPQREPIAIDLGAGRIPYGQSASERGALSAYPGLLMREFHQCQEERVDYDQAFCEAVTSLVGKRSGL